MVHEVLRTVNPAEATLQATGRLQRSTRSDGSLAARNETQARLRTCVTTAITNPPAIRTQSGHHGAAASTPLPNDLYTCDNAGRETSITDGVTSTKDGFLYDTRSRL